MRALNEFLRHGDWMERAERYRHARDVHLWHVEQDKVRGTSPDRATEDFWGFGSEPFSRLYEELGGPLVMNPDGRFGPLPFDPEGFASRLTTWDTCSLISFDSLLGVYGLNRVDEDFRLMLWPWVARLAKSYVDSLRTFDRGSDLKPSQLDATLAQIDMDALRLAENLGKLQSAERLSRPWHPSEYKRRLYLLSLNVTLGRAAVDVDRLRLLSHAARDLRGRVEDLPPTLKVSNAGKEALVCGAAYMWDALGGTVSAARRTSKTLGEESEFVLFVRSIARLSSNDVPTIAQVEASLRVDWPAWEAMAKVMFHHVDDDEISPQ